MNYLQIDFAISGDDFPYDWGRLNELGASPDNKHCHNPSHDLPPAKHDSANEISKQYILFVKMNPPTRQKLDALVPR
jgi:hypothetical protein